MTPVKCAGDGWLVVQSRGQFGNPQQYFSHRTYQEYIDGFGDPSEPLKFTIRASSGARTYVYHRQGVLVRLGEYALVDVGVGGTGPPVPAPCPPDPRRRRKEGGFLHRFQNRRTGNASLIHHT